MADTEREFAKTATVKGWRDAFLEFFADDAITFAPEVVPAKDGLRKQPSTPFSELELVWEPRLGDVAASGDLGWLTGPSTSINHTVKDSKPRYGCYLSIWRKQSDGRWRVFIDVGAGAPEAVSRSRPASRASRLTRDTRGRTARRRAGTSLAEADRDLNTQIGQGAARAFASRLTPASRLHRPGFVPIVGTDAIATWLNEHASTATAKDGAAESRGRRRLRIQLRHLRDHGADAAVGRLRPPLEPRRVRPLVADGRRRAAWPAVSEASPADDWIERWQRITTTEGRRSERG